MSSFAPDAREECTGYVDLWFLQRSKNFDCSLLRSDFAEVSRLLSPFSRFWTSVIEIEVLHESLLYCESSKNRSSLHSATILNHTITCLHTLFLEAILRYCSHVGPERLILRSLKIHRKLLRIATTIILSLC